jgi:hypothetical protein
LAEHFNLNDLQILAQDIGATWDELQGETLHLRAYSLVEWAQKTHNLLALTLAISRSRPSIDWRDWPHL